MSPSPLAAQKYTEVQNYDELIAAGVGEPFPILTLLVSGKGPEEQLSEIDFGRAAVAAFFAEHLTHTPPVDMTDRPPPVLKVKFLSNTTVVEFRAYAPWEPALRLSRGVCPLRGSGRPCSQRAQRALAAYGGGASAASPSQLC